MKNTFIKTFAVVAFVSIASFASAHIASANYSMNTASNDCQTVNIGNYTTGEGISDPCWTETTTSASIGDVINVAIYYHNSGTTDAPNVSFTLNNPSGQVNNGSVSFTGDVLVNGQVVASGIVSASVPNGSELTFGHVAQYTQGSDTNETLNNGSDIFTSQGLSIGSVAPGWNNQGVIKISFNVTGNNNCTNCNNNGQEPTVQTLSPYVDGNEVTLNGTYDSNNNYGSSNVTTWFQYEGQNNSSWQTVGSENEYATSGSMDYTLSDLPSGTYEYEAVAQNSYGTVYGNEVSFTIGNNNTQCGYNQVWNGYECVNNVQTCSYNQTWNGYECITNTQTCGYNQTWNGYECIQNVQTCSYGQTWNGYECVNNVTTSSLPSVTTLGTIDVTSSSAAVDGYYNDNSCVATTHFDYGTTQSLGQTTGSVVQSAASGSMAQALTGLAANTTYYYEAVAQNCAGTSTGSVNSFTTTGYKGGGNSTNTIVYDTIGGGNAFLQLSITNNESTVTGDVNTPYDITWKNISGETLNNIVLEVNFPTQMTIVDPGIGSIEPGKSSVVYHIDELTADETGQMTVIGDIKSGMKQGDPVVAQAVAAFQNPKSDAQENAIAYDADTFAVPSSVLGASIFGIGFLPTSLGGWLLLILILLIIIIIAHYYFVGRHKQVTVVHTQTPIAPAPVPPSNIPTGDYTVYTPTPKS